METATVLVKEPNKNLIGDKIIYFTIPLPEYFYDIYDDRERLEDVREQIKSLYQFMTIEEYVMVKFDKIEKYFDQ